MSAALLLATTLAGASPEGEAPDFSRVVFLGDGFTAGEANGTLFDGQSAPEPVPLGQREAFPTHVAAAMGTAAAYPDIEYPGIAGRNQVILKPDFCEFDEDAFLFLLGTGVRVNPFALSNVLAVPRHTLRDALDRRWSIDVTNLDTTVDSMEDFLLGMPAAFVGAPPASQVESAGAQQPTFAVVWLGLEDVLGAARRGDARGITSPRQFARDLEELLDAVETTGAQVAIANVPDPTVLPYFMPHRELLHYLRERREPGDARIDDDALAILFGAKRRGYVTRTFQTFSTMGAIADGLAPPPLVGTQRLDAREVRRIRRAVRRYNRTIRRQARDRGLVLVDVHTLFRQMRREGIDVGGVRMHNGFLGGLFGLDGVHLTNTGHALVARAFIEAINAQCGATLAPPDVAAVAAADPLAECVRSAPTESIR